MINITPYYDSFLRIAFSITARTRFLYRFSLCRFSHIVCQGSENIELFFDRLNKTLDISADTSAWLKCADKEAILKDANSALNHQFEVLGSGHIEMQTINWSKDIKTGHVWDNSFYTNYYIRKNNGVEIKVPWEISRCHHLLWLGEAYLLSNDKKYASEIVNQIYDWIKNNPFMNSVNWACSMEVAIRAVNWLYSIAMISKSGALSDSFMAVFIRSLYLHGNYIYHNLEKSHPYSNNHYFSDIVGLLYLGAIFSGKRKGNIWFNFALKEYYKEIRVQVLPSGVDCERSVSYHRLMTELAVYPYYMLKRIGVNIPMDVEYRLKSMLAFVQAYIKPNGKVPLVEDNDDGRFLPFLKRDFQNHSYLTDTNSIEIKLIAQSVELLRPLENSSQSDFTDAGHVIIKNDNAYLFVTNGGLTPYRDNNTVCGTHTHNDRLSFELSIGADDIIVDPGAYIYTSDLEKHHEFRSTFKHNTVFVDGEEQNILLKRAFLVKKNSHKEVLRYFHPKDCLGSYETIKGKMRHQRFFSLEKESLTIEDQIEKEGDGHLCQVFFHLSPMVTVEIVNDMFILYTQNSKIKMSFICSNPLSLSVIDDTISPSYGLLTNSKTIKIETSFDENITFKTYIGW